MSRRIALPWSAALIIIVSDWSPAAAVVTLDGDFDSGSLQSYSVVGNTIRLVGRPTYAGSGHDLGENHWRWLYFRATGVQGLTPTFSVSRRFAGDATPGAHELSDHEMVYSYDGATWSFFPRGNNTLSNTGTASSTDDVFTFRSSTPFTQNEVYVAYAIPYPYARTIAHSQEVLASPWGAPTISGDAGGVIGQSPLDVDDLGRTVPAQDLFAYRLTNPATDGALTKRRAVFTAGQHAAETLGVYVFEGLVDWLISDDPRAAALRDRAEFFCYPGLNASGRYAGLSRAMLGAPNSDSNGSWNPGPGDNPNDPYDSSTNWLNRPEQRLLGEAMLADLAPSSGAITDLLVDFHSSVPDYTIVGPNGLGTDGRDDWGYVSQGQSDHPWWQKLRQLQPNLLEVASSSGPGSRTMTGFGYSYLNADMAVTLENQFAISRPIAYYQELGRNVGLAAYQAWVQTPSAAAADFDEDGEVDGADLTAWTLGLGVAAGAAHYQGDADGDGAVDGADLLLWQRSAMSPTAVAFVPEPAAILQGLFGVAAAWSGRRGFAGVAR